MGNTKSTKVVVINETETEIEAKLTIREKVLGEPCLISGKSEDSEHSPEGEIPSEYIWYTVMIYDFRSGQKLCESEETIYGSNRCVVTSDQYGGFSCKRKKEVVTA